MVELFEYWEEHCLPVSESVHALLCVYTTYEPSKRYSSDSIDRDGDGENSHQSAVEGFVKEWGGEVYAVDNLPAFIQADLAERGIYDPSRARKLRDVQGWADRN